MQSTCSSLSEERKASNSYKAIVNNLLHKKDDSVKVYKEKFKEPNRRRIRTTVNHIIS